MKQQSRVKRSIAPHCALQHSVLPPAKGKTAIVRTIITRMGALRTLKAAVLSSSAAMLVTPAFSETISGAHGDGLLAALHSFDRQDIGALALIFGLTGFAVLTAIVALRGRARAQATENMLRHRVQDLRSDLDRARAILSSDAQVIVSWAAGAEQADLIGDVPALIGEQHAATLLAFGTWLAPDPALTLEDRVDALRTNGESFDLNVTTLDGRAIEISGRVIGGRALMRLREMSGLRREVAELTMRHQASLEEASILRELIDSLPGPVWLRTANNRLGFVNKAYANAVEARDANDVAAQQIELLDSDERVALTQGLATTSTFAARVPIVISGDRRIFDLRAVSNGKGSAAIALDASEAADARAALTRMAEAHRRTLDQLATGVAIFDAHQRLAFYNDAYRQLWDLDPAFLDSQPNDSDVLNRLRTTRKLPEDEDFHIWKQKLHEAYRAIESREAMWHLPDGRTLRVITTPNQEGGVTYIFENVTERLDLERRFDALIRVQRETLDNLAEGVAVFGSNGCLRLHNPSFALMWELPDERLQNAPHIDAVIECCKPLFSDTLVWHALRAPVTGIENRASVAMRMERADDKVIDCMTTPLPDGATMLTFQDITAANQIERALMERNEALEAASRVKVDFVHHVSYELRSPLTTIIGFAHFLGDPSTGPLTIKQKDYLNYITVSTNALLAIINNILDLATIDAGAMTLSLGDVDVRAAISAAAEGVQDRLVKDNIALRIDAPQEIGTFQADERRIVQVLYNLLSNAAGFAPPGSAIDLIAERLEDRIIFRVRDRGPGIPVEFKDRVFDWFESKANGSQHRGAGLGLSLVRSFVELHGGVVRLESPSSGGTIVVCEFPLEAARHQSAAE